MIVMGKVSNYTITEASNGNAQVAISFAFQNEQAQSRNLTWYGSFAGGAKKITLKSLAACGLVDAGRIGELINGPSSNLLDMNRDVQLDIQTETIFQQDGTEKTIDKIQWVNDPALAPGLKTIDQGKWSQFAMASNLASDFSAILSEIQGGAQAPQQQNHNPYQQGNGANGVGNQNQSNGAPMQNSVQNQGNMQGTMPMNNQMNQGQAPGNAPF